MAFRLCRNYPYREQAHWCSKSMDIRQLFLVLYTLFFLFDILAKAEKAVKFKEEVQVLDFESDDVTIDEVMAA